MKPITIALLIASLTASACTTRVAQGPDSQPQTSSSRSARTEISPSERTSTSYPERSLWGGFPLNPAGSLWGSFSIYPARSLWGGFPLRPDNFVSAKTSSFTSLSSEESSPPASCEATDDFCIIPHRFPFQRPFSSDFNTTIDSSYLYGSTQFGALEPHHGVEIPNPTGTPVLAVEDGTVVVAGNDAHYAHGPWENFYGNLVVLAHNLPGIPETVYTLYGHLSTVKVQVGQEIEAGELIGEVGATGSAIGSHLHFEVRVGDNNYTDTRNPALWLIPLNDEHGQQYGVLAGKLDNLQGNPIYFTVKAEYYPDINGSPDKTIYIETYATDIEPIGSNDQHHENFVLTDLPPGHYRIALSVSGKWTERWVEVESGKLSFVTIISR